jgi:hypothetical protein
MSFPNLTSPIIVTGLQSGIPASGNKWEYPVRTEWGVFKQDINRITLFVKALERIMSQPQDQPTSYFQVAGDTLTLW